VAYSLRGLLDEEDIPTGLEYYNEIKESSDYYIDVDEMNIAGYELLHSDNPQKAEFVFKLNIEAFPNSFIVHASYGEMLLVQGVMRASPNSICRSIF
jgi:hypothetical protein